jgi:hypothetical protein
MTGRLSRIVWSGDYGTRSTFRTRQKYRSELDWKAQDTAEDRQQRSALLRAWGRPETSTQRLSESLIGRVSERPCTGSPGDPYLDHWIAIQIDLALNAEAISAAKTPRSSKINGGGCK